MDITNIKAPNVKEIGNYALHGTKLQTAEFENLKSLNDYALADLLTLNMVNLGKVENIGYSALYNDANLEQIFINNTDYTIVLGSKAFYTSYDATSLTRVYIAATTPPSIQEDTFPASRTVFIWTFYKTYFYVPRQSVSNYQNATNWSNRSSYINSSAESYNQYYYSKNDDTLEVNIVEYVGNVSGTLTIPETFTINNTAYKVTSIDGAAFDSSSVTTLLLPRYLTSVGENFLDNNNSITNILVNSENTLFSSVDGVLYDYNKETLIRYPKARTDNTYSLDDTTRVLANGSFINSTSLNTLNFNNGLIAIGTDVFKGSNSLRYMNFTSVTSPYLMGFGSFPTNYNLTINYPTESSSAYTNNLFYYSYRNYLRAN